MNERIIIKNFAGIRSIELELSLINILIGPQATGKSICAKLLYFFKEFIHQLFLSVENQQTKHEFDKSILDKFEDYFPPTSWSKGGFLVRYELGSEFIEVSKREVPKSRPRLSYSNSYLKERDHSRRFIKGLIKEHADEEKYDIHKDIFRARGDFIKNISSKFGDPSTFNQLFIPAGRSFFANLQSSIFSFLSSNKAIDPFLTEFGSFYESIKSFPIESRLKEEKDKKFKEKIDEKVEEILHGKHVRERGKDYLILPDGRRTTITNSSSGQQEMLPLAIILKVLSFLKFLGGGQSIYIEEPEAHLFPTSQRHIVELMAMIFNFAKIPVQFIITTHSPYILTAFNNLMQAGSICSKISNDRKEKLYDIVPAEQILESSIVRAYSLSNGTADNICCEDTGLITTNIIDDVSNALATQFGDLLDIE